MQKNSAGGRDKRGVAFGVSWHRCPQCRTIVDDFGSVMTLRDQAQAEYEAVKANRRAKA